MIKLPVTAVIITLNEAHIVGRTIGMLDWCDEILVVDSGSSDDTVAICEELGCQVMYNKFEGYGHQKRFGIEKAKHDWVLSVDADEVLSDKLREEILSVWVSKDEAIKGFYLPFALVFMGRVFRYGERAIYGLKLFDRRCGNFDTPQVHEQVHLTGKTSKLIHPGYHYSYRNLSHYFDKFNEYSSRSAKKYHAQRKGGAVLMTAFRLPITFFHYYILKGCFLNGFPGLVWSLCSAFHAVVKYAKLWELQRDIGDHDFE